MSLQKMISDVETERAHNRAMGDSLSDQLRDIKFRFGEEIDALIAALQIEVDARDQALARIAHGEPHA
jgi:hypothetical protein